MFSLDSFVIVIKRAIDIVAEQMKKESQNSGKGEGENEGENEEEPEEEEDVEMTPEMLKERVGRLIDSITFEGFNYTRRGLLEQHKLLVATMLTFRIMISKGEINAEEVSSLVKREVNLDKVKQAPALQFFPEVIWNGITGLDKNVEKFNILVNTMEGEALQWKKWYGEEKAEIADYPKSCKDFSNFHKLLLLRAMRPDRLTGALTEFVRDNLGIRYVEQPPFDMVKCYNEMQPNIPTFFVLFPGVDPTPDVERVCKEIGGGKFTNISMGQGQEEIAAKALIKAGKEGGWIMLQNVHLMQTWMKIFERQLEEVCEEVHDGFRCFISSEPPPLPHMKIIPESILQNSIKVANEAPQDLKANIQRAFSKFGQDRFDNAPKSKYLEFKALLFGLCMFHSLILGRRKFGAQGWSRKYNFNDGDLTICADVLNNYLNNYEQIPYSDLRYIYGEIMYGGHITDNWDRRTNATYLEVLIIPEIMKGMQLTCAPGFKSPDPNRFEREGYEKYVEEKLPPEVPQMFGLHPNAEIGYLTTTAEDLFTLILSVSGGGTSSGGKKKEEIAKELIDEFLEQLPEDFNLLEIEAKITGVATPYDVVIIQECERMNGLLQEIRNSLNELDSGLKGHLNITDAMEDLATSLSINATPKGWEVKAYFSKKSLSDWFVDLLQRVQQFFDWQDEMEVPKSLWISGLFNPMSFLTAIMQVTSREHQYPLDSMCLRTDVTNIMESSEITEKPEDGMYIHGYFLEGAGWELGRGNDQGYLTEMKLKELHPVLPVMKIVAVQREERSSVGFYECPVYMTTMRGPTFIFTAWLKMESDDSDDKEWILAGVALLQAPE